MTAAPIWNDQRAGRLGLAVNIPNSNTIEEIESESTSALTAFLTWPTDVESERCTLSINPLLEVAKYNEL